MQDPREETSPSPTADDVKDLESNSSDNEDVEDDESVASSVKEMDEDDELVDSDENSKSLGDDAIFKSIAEGTTIKQNDEDGFVPKKSKIVQRTVLETLGANDKIKKTPRKRGPRKNDPAQQQAMKESLLKAVMDYQASSPKKGQVIIYL